MLSKVFPINLKPADRLKTKSLVETFAQTGPKQEAGTLSFRVYRDPAKPDYLLSVEHFADQGAYNAHTSSAGHRELIAGQFSTLVIEFVEIDHELLVSMCWTVRESFHLFTRLLSSCRPPTWWSRRWRSASICCCTRGD